MFPSLDEVRAFAADGRYRRVPVCMELLADRFTPTEVLRTLRSASNHCFLLESAETDGTQGRYSFLGFNPTLELTCTNGLLRIREGGADELERIIERVVDHPGPAIREVLARYASPQVAGMPPLAGGLVGYFSYDYVKYSERRLRDNQLADRDFRDVDLMLFDQVIVFDHRRQKLLIIAGVQLDAAASRVADRDEENGTKAESAAAAIPSPAGNVDALTSAPANHVANSAAADPIAAAYAHAQAACERIAALIEGNTRAYFAPLKLHEPLAPRFTQDAFTQIIEHAKHYIHEGDIFQVVLSNPLSAQASGSLFDAYRVLRASNPSPYMFFFTSDDVELAGASPETLTRLEDGVVKTFPLAGTRPRGATDVEDAALEASLLADEKELAEHNMLVDLGRNDLGRICKLGSVHVDEYLSIHRFSHVMHIGSEVSGRLRDDADAVDAIDSILPAGTLSGAPKLRACEIIQELEGTKRGIYGGAVGYLDFTGNMDTCISIRLAYKKDGRVCVQSGAGIVADSNPASEYAECRNKARAVVAAIQAAEGGVR